VRPIARDYETHIIETSDGQTHTGMIKSDTPHGVALMDSRGQEEVIRILRSSPTVSWPPV
jgi:hypothetical protein